MKLKFIFLMTGVAFCSAAQKRDPVQLPKFLSRDAEFDRKYNSDQQEMIERVNRKRDYYKDSDWHEVTKAAKEAILKHGIHPDDIIQWSAPILDDAVVQKPFISSQINCAEFARFLLAHGSNPNGCVSYKPILRHATTVPTALALIAHGAQAGNKYMWGWTLLHNFSLFRSDDAAQLALLYYMAGADPRAVDQSGHTALMWLAEDISREHQSTRNKGEFNKLLKLAATLVRIGVPLDAQATRETRFNWERESIAFQGDDVRSILQRGQLRPAVAKQCMALEELLDKEQKEVDGYNGQRDSRLRQALLTFTPLSTDPCSIIVGYAKEHVLPPSVVPDLKNLRQEVILFKKQYAAERKKEAE